MIKKPEKLNFNDNKLQPFKFENTHSIGPGGIMKMQHDGKGQEAPLTNEGHGFADDFNNGGILNNTDRLNLSQINENVGAGANLSPNNANSVNFLNRAHPSSRL